MKTVAIIQARMGSSRLPGKILEDIAGEAMLRHVVRRVGRAKTIDRVVVATTNESQDDPVAEFCQLHHIHYFRGDHLDVLDRYYQAALANEAKTIVRVTSDCPLIDPGVIDQVVRKFHDHQPDVDYVSNVLEPRTFPRGLDVEVFRFAALSDAWNLSTGSFFREHVTTYIYGNPKSFRLMGVTNRTDESHSRWTVDTQDDLRLVRAIFKAMGSREFTWKDVLAMSKKHPEWAVINGHVEQKVA